MNTKKATEQSQDSARDSANLDERYGKIGISAVAAAVSHVGVQRSARDSRRYTASYDRD
jgi:hypothetical protein